MRRYMLGIAFAITSFMPAIGLADDQQIADFIKSRLQAHQQQGQLRGFNVDMTVERGVVWFKGHVSNADQESLILQTAQQAGHLGVERVVDDIEVLGSLPAPAQASQTTESNPLQMASFQQQQTPPQVPMRQAPIQQAPIQQAPIQQAPIQQAPMQQAPIQQAPIQQAPIQQAPMSQVRSQMPQGMANMAAQSVSYGRPQDQVMNSGAMGGSMPMAFAETSPRAPMMDGNCGPGCGQGYGGSMPMGYGGGQAMGGSESPNLPGYAWPGYAAHPNYGQVNYPKQYSASAWPYIGPFYPYPQVPLGWRKVSLEWDDGWWWLDFHDKCGSNR